MRAAVAMVSAAVSVVAGVAPTAVAGPDLGSEPGPRYSFLVLTEGPAGVDLVQDVVRRAGGEVVYGYRRIGVVVARGEAGLADAVRGRPGVGRVGVTRTVALPAGVSPAGRAAADPGEAEQWNLAMVGAYDAWRTTEGSPDVVVAVADSGVDDRHPDLAPNFDASMSVDCSTGRPDQTNAAWRPPSSDHGTHVAGTIAAARDGAGVVGVAPRTRIASVRIGDADAMFHAEASVCAFVWMGEHAAQGLRIANHSYYNDPWWTACPDDEDQAVYAEAITRAAAFAAGRGVLSIAAMGNEAIDLAHKTHDPLSPSDGARPDQPRPVTAACRNLPVELPDVVAVSALGTSGRSAGYTNTGLGIVDLAAPGGDRAAGGEGVLSTSRDGGWSTKEGTSMATPVVSGVAALIAARHPTWGPADIAAHLYATATRLPCEDPCTAAGDVDAFHGHGMVDAARAVER